MNQWGKSHPPHAVNNESFHPSFQIGTSGWIICDANGCFTVEGNNTVQGYATIQCSHCSELSGPIGAVQHVNKMCKQFNITDGTVDLECHGLEAYKIATR